MPVSWFAINKLTYILIWNQWQLSTHCEMKSFETIQFRVYPFPHNKIYIYNLTGWTYCIDLMLFKLIFNLQQCDLIHANNDFHLSKNYLSQKPYLNHFPVQMIDCFSTKMAKDFVQQVGKLTWSERNCFAKNCTVT